MEKQQQMTGISAESVSNRFELICKWLEENDNTGDMQMVKHNDTGIAILCLQNPTKCNALTGKMMVKFSHLITELENWKEGKALIVYGSKNFFCSGLNLNLVKSIVDSEWHSTQMALLMIDNFQRLDRLHILTIALVEGKALGGGAEFAANLDMRISADNALIGFVHKKMGISSAWGGGVSLTRILGPFRALEVFLSARLIDVKEAVKIGFVNYVVLVNRKVNKANFKTNKITNSKLDVKSSNQPSISVEQELKFSGKDEKLNNNENNDENHHSNNAVKKNIYKRCKLDLIKNSKNFIKRKSFKNKSLNNCFNSDYLNEIYIIKHDLDYNLNNNEDKFNSNQRKLFKLKNNKKKSKLKNGHKQQSIGINLEDDNSTIDLVYNWLSQITLLHNNLVCFKNFIHNKNFYNSNELTFSSELQTNKLSLINTLDSPTNLPIKPPIKHTINSSFKSNEFVF